MCPAFEQEQDLQNLFRLTTTLGNLCYKSDDAFELLGAMDVTFPDLSKLADQPDAAKQIQLIKEIRTMLKI